MTGGLLISRSNKLKLLKKSIAEPSLENTQKYKNYRNIFNILMRRSKKLYFSDNLKNIKKILKKPGQSYMKS
jgi:hypothetical protein